MTQPNVLITELDGALGVLPSTLGALLAVVGAASSGPFDTPATFGRTSDVIATFGKGPAVEAAAEWIEKYGRPVLFTRSHTTVAASADAIVLAVTGTSVVSETVGTPLDDYEMKVVILTGGTIGVAGITYKESYDGGRTYGVAKALGTATTLVFADAGLTFNFAAGTLIAGDYWTARTHAATWNTTDLGTALAALKNSSVIWELAQIVGAVDGAGVDALDLAFAGMAAVGKYHAWVGNTRIPNAGESESAYATALGTLISAHTSKYGSLYGGADKMISSVSGRQYRRPVSFKTGALEASVSEEIDIADVNLGSLNVSIRDINGNPDEHDESINPGLDDLRLGTLRTWGQPEGVYVNRPRLFSPTGSDFQLMPHRRVMNLTLAALRNYFIFRLNRPVIVSKLTGFIVESEALEIESGALSVMRTVLLAKPKASDALFRLSRTDNLLSTRTFTASARVLPLAYPEFVNLDVGFFNPALQLVAA